MNCNKSTYFTYKGVNSKDYNLKIITIGDANYTTTTGIQREMQTEARVDGRILSYNTTYTAPTSQQIIVAHADENDVPIEHTLDWLKGVSEWLLSGNNFQPIWFDEYEDKLCYYVKILKIDRWDNFADEGYFTLTIMPLDDYIYTRPYWKTITAVEGTSSIFYITNESNMTSINPYLVIEPRTTTLKIKNLSTGYSTEFTNIPLSTHQPFKIKLYNEDQIILTEYQDYDLDKFNWNWFKLKQGINTIQIEGQCIIDMQLSFPLAI